MCLFLNWSRVLQLKYFPIHIFSRHVLIVVKFEFVGGKFSLGFREFHLGYLLSMTFLILASGVKQSVCFTNNKKVHFQQWFQLIKITFLFSSRGVLSVDLFSIRYVFFSSQFKLDRDEQVVDQKSIKLKVANAEFR